MCFARRISSQHDNLGLGCKYPKIHNPVIAGPKNFPPKHPKQHMENIHLNDLHNLTKKQADLKPPPYAPTIILNTHPNQQCHNNKYFSYLIL